MKLKLGLDVDGVIDTIPEVLSKLSTLLVLMGHEVHIITGNKQTPEFEEKLRDLGIRWSHFFSISDHHKALGTPMTGYDEGQPWIDPAIWDRTKGWYCKEHQIDLHLDDSRDYGKYFETPYLLFHPKGHDHAQVYTLHKEIVDTSEYDSTKAEATHTFSSLRRGLHYMKTHFGGYLMEEFKDCYQWTQQDNEDPYLTQYFLSKKPVLVDPV